MHRHQRPSDSAEETQESDQWQRSWNQHRGWLRTVIAARMDAVWVDEVLQNVAIQAWNHRTQLENPEKLGPWLYRIALQQVSLFFRKRKQVGKPVEARAESVSVDELNVASDRESVDPLTMLTRSEVHRQLRSSMTMLPAEDREILELKHSQGWTYQQIAEHLGLKIDQVIYRTGRAKERLRLHLACLDIDEYE